MFFVDETTVLVSYLYQLIIFSALCLVVMGTFHLHLTTYQSPMVNVLAVEICSA